MKKVFAYWTEFFIELRVWWKYRKAAIQAESILTENNMRVDWLGRIYSVVNMPEEVQNNMEVVQQGWVIGQLRPMNDVLFKIGLADYTYPSISKIPGSVSFLVIMWPELDTLNIWRLLANLVATAGFLAFIWLLYVVVDYLGLIDLLQSIKRA